MKTSYYWLILFLLGTINLTYGQYYSTIQSNSFFDGKFTIKKETYSGYTFILFDCSRENKAIKAKYFAQNAYSQYTTWKAGKEILLVTAGNFVDGWGSEANPVGLCVDNGTIVNRTPNDNMDGMVILYNNGAQDGGMAVVDMDVHPIKTPDGSYNPRTSPVDRVNFLTWAQKNGLSLFQTQLVYSSDRSPCFPLNYGPKRERRFLAICKKAGVIHHVIVDAPDPLELNVSSRYAKSVLESNGLAVSYILNLETGGHNFLLARDGTYLQEYKPINHFKDSYPMIVYYK
ncbi:hypothetical protein GCM10028805_55640 [Spirosoma harenae]